MIKIKPITNIHKINNNFNSFSKQTLENNRADFNYVISQLQKYESDYRQLDSVHLFMQKAQQFAEDCFNKGMVNFTGIIYAFLIKMPNLPFDVKEILIKRAIQIAQSQNDKVHELGRVADLKILYKQNGDVPKKNYIKTLLKEEEILKTLVRTYEECSENYKTISREMCNRDKYKHRLAISMVDIAKALYKTDTKSALHRLKSARSIFKEVGSEKDLFLTEGLIKKITR